MKKPLQGDHLYPPDPLDNEDNSFGGSNNSGSSGVVSDLWEYVSKQPTMSQKEVITSFAELDSLVSRSFELANLGDFGYRYILDVLSSVAASLTHNKTIYSKTGLASNPDRIVTPKNDARYIDPLEVYYADEAIAFLERGFEFAHHLSIDPARRIGMEEAFKDLRITRAVLQEVIDLFVDTVDEYIELSHLSVHFHNKNMSDDEYSDKNSQRLIRILTKMHEIEDTANISGGRLYSVCRELFDILKVQHTLVSKIVAPFLRIVSKESIAKAKSESQVLENFQYGSIGLLQAVLSYDQSIGAVFSAYARFWVIQSILYHLKKTSNFFRLPNSVWQARTTIEKARKKIISEKGTCTIDDVAKATSLSRKKVSKVYDYISTSKLLSLDYYIDDRSTLGETIQDDRDYFEDPPVVPAEIVSNLPPLQRTIIALRYGLFDLLPGGNLPDEDLEKEKRRQEESLPNKDQSVNKAGEPHNR